MNKLLAVGILGLLSWAVSAANVEYYTVEDYTVVAIQDAPHSIAASLFGEEEEVRQKLQKLYPRDAAPSSVNVFLLQQGNRFILVDSGLGSNPTSLLTKTLGDLRVDPARVTDILLTHLHPDHIGGLMSVKGQKVFPNATLWVSQEEFKGMKMASRYTNAKIRNVYLPYQYTMKRFSDGQEILPGIVAKVAPGHTPGHTTFLLRNKLLFVGDLLHAAVWQFAAPELCTEWDADPKQAVASRRAVFQRAQEEKLLIAGAHLPFPGIGKVMDGAERGEFLFVLQKGK